jgi:2'-5' RNA ligase
MTLSTLHPGRETQRLFIAVPLPDPLKRTLGAWSKDIRIALSFRKWTNEADLHVTLQFLGDTASDRIPELQAALAAAAGSGRIQPFYLTVQDTGTFGRIDQPKVFWAGIGGEVESLHSLRRLIAEAMTPLGFTPEERPYSPHLTIARSYQGIEPFRLPELAGSRDAADPFRWQVNEIVLYRTHMHRSPMYEAAARFPLL